MGEAYWSLESVPAEFPPSVVTIGNFDGIHLGHRKILKLTLERARAEGLRAAAMTFDPHPSRIVAPEHAPLLMTTPRQRVEKFFEHGVDAALVLPFTAETAALTPEEFVVRVLVEKLRVRRVVVGENFRFGRRSEGNVDTLKELGRKFDFEAEPVAAVRIGGHIVSSTRIRGLVAEGRVETARRLLGESYRLEGPVVGGRGVGSKLTAPTLNLDPEAELIPADGVYVSATRDPDSGPWRASVTNVGVRPTFGAGARTVETHILDEFQSEAPARIEVFFHRRLREERKFDSAEELRGQIRRDVARARRYFSLLDAVSGEPVRELSESD